MKTSALMEQISNNIANCEKCRLRGLAHNPVPGEGSHDAKLIFIGEAPGANEDKTGRPFVGRAGNLLEKLLAEIGYKREDVWIGNIIKHRPPENRDPLPDEVAACAPYLAMQLKALNPVLIVTLGRYAMNYFYPEGKISRDRGHLLQIDEKNIYPVYHPAAGLRNSKMLNALKEDFLRIPSVMDGIQNPSAEEKGSNNLDNGQLGLF